MRSNSLPSGHTDFNRCRPSLEENFLEGVLVAKVPSASFRPEVIEDKAMEDVEWLSKVSEAAGVVRKEPRRVILVPHGSFSKKHKRPGRDETSGSFPFVPYSFVNVPRALGHGALEKAMLGKFLGARITNFALRGDPHELESGANWEALVEG
ncbi:unnamed protein product [Sphagnum jensenii]|uniref:Uncharacterized protein n=1 Tax=Sphagnum jensenii TaxID=128206 RepID=A0ABP1C1K7_9BRYO